VFVGFRAKAGVHALLPHSTLPAHSTYSLDAHEEAHTVPVNDLTTAYVQTFVSGVPLPQHVSPD
jgi:hypothetical protein